MYHAGIFPLEGGIPLSPSTLNIDDADALPSTWLVAPYFLIYFIMFTINTLVWPLQLMERACINVLPEDEAIRFKFNEHDYNQAANSCISYYLTDRNQSDNYNVSTNSTTLNVMIVAAFGGGVVSLLSYFLIWKPLLARCRSASLFLPPICMICQSLILMRAQSITNFDTYKYTVLSSVMVPSLHCSFQGVFLLFFHMSEVPEVKTKREIMNTRLDGSHVIIFVSILFVGCFIAGCYDLTYNLVFFLQFTLGSVNIMYAFSLLPTTGTCMSGVEEQEEKEKNDEVKSDDCSEDFSDSSTEEFLLGDMARNCKDGGLLTKQVNILKEAPMIFSETSYKMELIIIIEVCVFTAAMVADTGVSGLYFVQGPLSFDLRVFGACIAAQGLMKIAGMLFIKAAIRFSQLKHGTLIAIALMNYTGYYIALSLPSTNVLVIAVMFTNVFGGLAFPTIFSFIKINFRETAEAVLEISIVSSLVVTMGYTALEYFIYEKTRNLFPGAIFMLTASVLAISAIIILATYLSSTKKNQRKSKFFADHLLNNDQ